MKVTCEQKDLKAGLGIVGRAVATTTTLPITQNVLMATDHSMLKLLATNLEMTITTWIGAMVEEEGSITVPARLLTEFVGSLPAERIDLAMTPGPRSLQLTCSRSQTRLSGTDAEAFPPIPTVGDGLRVKIDPGTLKAGIRQVVFAAATEESRPVLTGVKLELEDDRFTMIALDGFRMAVHKGRLEEPIKESASVILPARSMNALNQLIGGQDEPVEISMGRGQVLFNLKGIEVVFRLTEGTFPKYSTLMPQTYLTRTVFNLKELTRVVKTASFFALGGSDIIRLQMTPGPDASSPGKVEIMARAEEMGDSYNELNVSVVGELSKIAFNSKYLLDVLSALDGPEVALETTIPSSPGVFRSVGSDSHVYVLMPMFVEW